MLKVKPNIMNWCIVLITTWAIVQVICLETSIGLEFESGRSYQSARKCKNDTECKYVCKGAPGLGHRCDQNGTCCCDCSDPFQMGEKLAEVPIPEPCRTWVNSQDHERCQMNCFAIYERRYKLCKMSEGSIICTCIC